jgi:hypothetical protein
MNRRGIALVSVLFVLVALLVLSPTLFFSVFLDLQSTSNASAGEDALYVAEAAIHRTWAALGRGPDFADALSWPNGTPPFGAATWFPQPPRGYRVHVAPSPDGALLVTSEGTSHRGARARVEATFRRNAAFDAPAALVLDTSLARVAIGGAIDVVSDPASGAPPPVGAEDETAAGVWQSSGVSGSLAVVGPSGLRTSLDGIRVSADGTLTGPFASGSWGTAAAPQVTRLVTDAHVTGDVTAYGVVLADAPLHVSGRLEVTGLLLAAAGIVVEGELAVRGAAWIAELAEVPAGGSLSVAYDAPALENCGNLRPGVLPREAVLGGWRELW